MQKTYLLFYFKRVFFIFVLAFVTLEGISQIEASIVDPNPMKRNNIHPPTQASHNDNGNDIDTLPSNTEDINRVLDFFNEDCRTDKCPKDNITRYYCPKTLGRQRMGSHVYNILNKNIDTGESSNQERHNSMSNIVKIKEINKKLSACDKEIRTAFTALKSMIREREKEYNEKYKDLEDNELHKKWNQLQYANRDCKANTLGSTFRDNDFPEPLDMIKVSITRAQNLNCRNLFRYYIKYIKHIFKLESAREKRCEQPETSCVAELISLTEPKFRDNKINLMSVCRKDYDYAEDCCLNPEERECGNNFAKNLGGSYGGQCSSHVESLEQDIFRKQINNCNTLINECKETNSDCNNQIENFKTEFSKCFHVKKSIEFPENEKSIDNAINEMFGQNTTQDTIQDKINQLKKGLSEEHKKEVDQAVENKQITNTQCKQKATKILKQYIASRQALRNQYSDHSGFENKNIGDNEHNSSDFINCGNIFEENKEKLKAKSDSYLAEMCKNQQPPAQIQGDFPSPIAPLESSQIDKTNPIPPDHSPNYNPYPNSPGSGAIVSSSTQRSPAGTTDRTGGQKNPDGSHKVSSGDNPTGENPTMKHTDEKTLDDESDPKGTGRLAGNTPEGNTPGTSAGGDGSFNKKDKKGNLGQESSIYNRFQSRAGSRKRSRRGSGSYLNGNRLASNSQKGKAALPTQNYRSRSSGTERNRASIGTANQNIFEMLSTSMDRFCNNKIKYCFSKN